jgi:Major Facilitator Superfamily
MYLLEHVGMSLFNVLLLWTASWVGGAMLSNRLGAWAEKFGQRPVLVLCTLFKSMNMIALFCCPRDPQAAFWMLMPVFMFDAFLNAGVLIATNGFLLKNSPAENRTMFIAAGTAFAGMAGGATSVLAGALLASSDAWSWEWHGFRMVNFHVMFAVSIVLRVTAIAVAVRIHEPSSAGARRLAKQVLEELAAAAWFVPRRVVMLGSGRWAASDAIEPLAGDAPVIEAVEGEAFGSMTTAAPVVRSLSVPVSAGKSAEPPVRDRKAA